MIPDLQHQLTPLRKAPQPGDPCECRLGTYEREHGRLACPFCGFRPESVVVARWDPEAKR